MHAFLAVVMAVVTTVIPEPQADRHYVLMTSGRDHCLDLVDGVGPAIIHFRCHRGWQQQWTLTSDPGQITPRWEIKFKADPRKCVTATGGKDTRVRAEPCHLRPEQFWRVGDHSLIQSVAHPYQCLDANPHSDRVLLWDCEAGKPHQTWLKIPI